MNLGGEGEHASLRAVGHTGFDAEIAVRVRALGSPRGLGGVVELRSAVTSVLENH
jgi:hypothetical protein